MKFPCTPRVAACACLIVSLGAQAQVPADTEKEVAPQMMESIVVQGKFIDSGAKSAMKMDIPVRATKFTHELTRNKYGTA